MRKLLHSFALGAALIGCGPPPGIPAGPSVHADAGTPTSDTGIEGPSGPDLGVGDDFSAPDYMPPDAHPAPPNEWQEASICQALVALGFTGSRIKQVLGSEPIPGLNFDPTQCLNLREGDVNNAPSPEFQDPPRINHVLISTLANLFKSRLIKITSLRDYLAAPENNENDPEAMELKASIQRINTAISFVLDNNGLESIGGYFNENDELYAEVTGPGIITIPGLEVQQASCRFYVLDEEDQNPNHRWSLSLFNIYCDAEIIKPNGGIVRWNLGLEFGLDSISLGVGEPNPDDAECLLDENQERFINEGLFEITIGHELAEPGSTEQSLRFYITSTISENGLPSSHTSVLLRQENSGDLPPREIVEVSACDQEDATMQSSEPGQLAHPLMFKVGNDLGPAVKAMAELLMFSLQTSAPENVVHIGFRPGDEDQTVTDLPGGERVRLFTGILDKLPQIVREIYLRVFPEGN